MAKKKRNNRPKKTDQPTAPPRNEPWISMRGGVQGIFVLSIVLTLFMGWQLEPDLGWGQGLLTGAGFGVAIWVVFGVMLAFNRWVRR
jgi:Zn-dependent protease with chaperone function